MKSFITILIMMNIVNLTCAGETKKACFNVEGMTCATCPITTKAAIKKLDGIKNAQVSFEMKNAIVSYDLALTNPKEIKAKIDSVGYKATEVQCANY